MEDIVLAVAILGGALAWELSPFLLLLLFAWLLVRG